MRKIFSRSIVKIATILSLTSLVQAAQFHLPIGTSGRQEIVDPLGQVQPDTAFINEKFCEHVIVSGTTCHLYFPIDGSQPTTEEVGEYSGARYDGQRNSDVTDWWVRVFGGNMAVNASHRGFYDRLLGVQMGFDNTNTPVHIIQVNAAGAPANFER